ncbi:hypothetical protein [Deferrisoma sp.]
MWRAIRTTAAAALVPVAWVTTAVAATPGVREDRSGLLVWAFFGVCAVIVAAQLIPAILMLIGAAKGVAQGLTEKHPATEEETVGR